jgi:thioesterase domain-containing protein
MHAISITAARGEPINIIGHSYGGAAAINASVWAAAKGIHVDLLLTIDPVGGTLFTFDRSNVNRWINVRSTRANIFDFGDLAAVIGGRIPSKITDMADTNIPSNFHHKEFWE